MAAGDITQGRRVSADDIFDAPPGSYALIARDHPVLHSAPDDPDPVLWIKCPVAGAGLARCAKHDVMEHEDGTVTVSPSILAQGHHGEWHGYLERGVWREV